MHLDERARQAIEEILKRGNDAQVQRKGDGCKVYEVKRTVRHDGGK